MMDREREAQLMSESAARLFQLIEVKAPEIIIENQRQSLFRRMICFPVNADGLNSAKNLNSEMDKDRENFLHEHGFYKDVDDPTQGEGVEG